MFHNYQLANEPCLIDISLFPGLLFQHWGELQGNRGSMTRSLRGKFWFPRIDSL